MRATNLQLAERLIANFERAEAVEMPSRVFRFGEGTTKQKSISSGHWGQHPIVLIAVDDQVTLRSNGHDPVNLRVGDALLLSSSQCDDLCAGGSGSYIGFESLGTQPCRFFIADAVDPAGSRDCLEIFYSPFADDLPTFWRACHELHCLLESARNYTASSGGASDPALCSMIRLAVIECLRAVRGFKESIGRPMAKSNAARVGAAEMYVSCNIDRDIRKSELAEFLNVSVSQLTLAFREVGQLAVRDRIRFRRVESARNLLADTSLSVAEVAERVGMNYRHFIRAFRQNAVLTPLRYRKISRLRPKEGEVLKDYLHTENFDVVAALNSPNGDSPPEVSSKVTVLFSNASGGSVTVSRLESDGTFNDAAAISPGRRLSFIDKPGQLWKIEPRSGRETKGAIAEPTFYRVAEHNSHFVFPSEA